MTDFTPSQLARMDTQRLANYRANLDFYQGNHWPTQSRHRQLVFNYAKVSIDKVTSFLMPGLGFACYPGDTPLSLRAERGNLVVPTNVGQELLDVVTVTDERCGISEKNYRVQAIQTNYDRRQGGYEQRLTIGAP
jgi:hypothetical protein